ncbi:MAG TPA: hypothetical protein VN257_06610 [Actinotalea sp.]|nr:hypothetical protein [Actinotalea sp.]
MSQPADDPTPPTPERPAPERPAPPPAVVRATVRHAPRFRSFMGVGAVLGMLLGAVLTLTAPSGEADLAVLITLAGAFGLVGLLVGAVVGVVADTLSTRSRR